MLKINDIAYIWDLDERVDGYHAKQGDICIIKQVHEGGTEVWSGRDVDENYTVLNERTGETITLSWSTTLKLYDKPYIRKTAKELEEARKQAFMEWIEAEKQQLYESRLSEGDIVIVSCIKDIQELEKGYKDEKYTEKYFNTEMSKLINTLEKYSYKLNDEQTEFKNKFKNKCNK